VCVCVILFSFGSSFYSKNYFILFSILALGLYREQRIVRCSSVGSQLAPGRGRAICETAKPRRLYNTSEGKVGGT